MYKCILTEWIFSFWFLFWMNNERVVYILWMFKNIWHFLGTVSSMSRPPPPSPGNVSSKPCLDPEGIPSSPWSKVHFLTQTETARTLRLPACTDWTLCSLWTSWTRTMSAACPCASSRTSLPPSSSRSLQIEDREDCRRQEAHFHYQSSIKIQ